MKTFVMFVAVFVSVCVARSADLVQVHVINNSQLMWGNACTNGPASGEWPPYVGGDGYGFVDPGARMDLQFLPQSVILWGNPADNFPNALPALPDGFSDVWIFVNDDPLSANAGSIYGQFVTFQCQAVFRQ